MKLNIATKINVFATLLIIIPTIFLGWFIVTYETNSINTKLNEQANTIVNNLAYNSEYGILVGDKETLNRLLESIIREKVICYAIIKNKENKIIAGEVKSRQEPIKEFTAPIVTTTLQAKDELEITQKTVKKEKEEVIGQVRIGVSLSGMNQKIAEVKKFIILVILSVIIITIIVTFLGIEFLIAKPLIPLFSGIKRIGSGDLSHRVEVKTQDEIGELANMFNNMAEDLSKTLVSREELQYNYDKQNIINWLLRLSLEEIPLEKILNEALEIIISLWLTLEKKGAIFLIEDNKDILVMKTQYGLSEPIKNACAKVPFGRCLCGIAAKTQKIQFADSIDDGHNTIYNGITPHGHYCIPILYGNKTLGVLNLYLKEGHKRDYKEEEFLNAISDVLSGIIRQEKAEEEIREINYRLSDALAKLRETQQQIIQQERLRALGQMASGIAHDFNNLLTPILGFSELLLLKPKICEDKEKSRGYIEMIYTSAKDAGEVIKRLRDFYRKREKGESITKIDLNKLIEQTIQLTKPKWEDEAQGKGINITMETNLQQIPKIYGSESEVREVLTNLIFNSVGAIKNNGKINISTYKDLDEGVIEFSDTGQGMDEKTINRCFEPFFTTKGEEGSGLGLSIVYGIVQRHNGKIEVTSELGKGTTFIIKFPLKTDVIEKQEKIDKKLDEKKSTSHLNILVVDDKDLVRRTLYEGLTSCGHTVLTAESAAEGFEKFAPEKFDLVITDRAMPDLSGDQLAQMIKKISPLTPVIMLTGFGDTMEEKDEKPEGVDLILSKPITMEKLEFGINRVMKGGIEN